MQSNNTKYHEKSSCLTTIQWSIKGHLYQGQNQTFTNYYVKNYYVIYCCLDSFIDCKNDWCSSGKFFVAITQTVVMVYWSKCIYALVINILSPHQLKNIMKSEYRCKSVLNNEFFVMYLEIYRFYQFCTYTFQDRSQHRILTGPRHFSMVYLELTLFVLVITENKLLLFFIISNFSRYLLIKSLHNKDRPANFFSRDNQKKTFEKYTSEKKKWLYFQPILT